MSGNNSKRDQTIAFAGLCQVAHLVHELAKTGNCEQAPLETCLNSIVNTDPEDTEAVFGSVRDLHDGLNVMLTQLLSDKEKNAEIARYVIALTALERKLDKKPEVMNLLGERISQCQRQLHHFQITDEQVMSNLAEIYSDLISPLGPRIQVMGSPVYLQQAMVQHKIRSLLLAGVRCAVLWRQVGGKRRHILFARKQMAQSAQQLLQTI